jgi:molybdate transport system substrate-binding protein
MKPKLTYLTSALLLLAVGLLSGAPAVTAAAPTPAAAGVTITVDAAASLTDAFKVLGQQFELWNPGTKVVFNFAGSQILSQQINQGAPVDVFASANLAQMDAVVKGGRVSKSTIFVLNRLIVIYPAGSTQVKTLPDLAQPGLQIVLAARAVPVGQYSLDFLTRAGKDPAYGASFPVAVLSNVVSYEDNVKQVFTKVALGEADAGIVYTTDVLGKDAAKVGKITIPDSLNTIAKYPIAILNDSPSSFWARMFVKHVLSRDGQRTLAAFGFIPAAPIRPAR